MFLFDAIGLDIGYVLLGTIGVVIILFILLIIIMVKHKNLKKKYNQFMIGEDGRSLEKVITERFKEIESMKEHMSKNDERLNEIDNFLLKTYNKMAIVKYDAFREMGGSLSFALALLTESNDGFIINAMHSSREGCYTYIKNIEKGQCEAPLSEEEKEALEKAMK